MKNQFPILYKKRYDFTPIRFLVKGRKTTNKIHLKKQIPAFGRMYYQIFGKTLSNFT